MNPNTKPLILRTVEELRAWRKSLAPGETLGFVPTMGALHEGHLSLARLSMGRCSKTLVSIFVNPLQFGPKEDLARYPRPFERDCELLGGIGVDAVFSPSVATMYPEGASTTVVEDTVSHPLCGAMRPGHFLGVTTVVLKLFNLVQPDVAFFGQKDAQQCAVIERMVRDLDLPVEIIRGEIVREPDGLAMSSRNVYLSPEEREKAPLIYRSLKAAAAAYERGERDACRLEELGREALELDPSFNVQYWEVRHPRTLEKLETVGPDGALLAVAAVLGTTRLIDNWILKGQKH